MKGSRDPRPDLAGALSRAQKPWDEERFLFPELQDDSLLCHEWDNSTPAAEDTRMERHAHVACTFAQQFCMRMGAEVGVGAMQGGSWRGCRSIAHHRG